MAKFILTQTTKVKCSVRLDGTQECTGKRRTRVLQKTGNGLKGILAKMSSLIKKIAYIVLAIVLEELTRIFVTAWLTSKFNF